MIGGWLSRRLLGRCCNSSVWSTHLLASFLMFQPQGVLVLGLPENTAPLAALRMLDVSIPLQVTLCPPSCAHTAPWTIIRNFYHMDLLFYNVRLDFADCLEWYHRPPGGLWHWDGNEWRR